VAFDDTAAAAILAALEDHAATTGRFERVNGHEPKNAPGNGLSAAFWLQRIGPVMGFHSGLDSTSALLVWQCRLSLNMLYEPQDSIDPVLMGAAAALIGEYAGDFTLGDLVRCVDLRGMAGQPLGGEAGYLPQDGKLFRAYTLTIPLIFNDAWAEAA
jgi:hypothetical protein